MGSTFKKQCPIRPSDFMCRAPKPLERITYQQPLSAWEFRVQKYATEVWTAIRGKRWTLTRNRDSQERSVCITGSSSSHKFLEVHVLETATLTWQALRQYTGNVFTSTSTRQYLADLIQTREQKQKAHTSRANPGFRIGLDWSELTFKKFNLSL